MEYSKIISVGEYWLKTVSKGNNHVVGGNAYSVINNNLRGGFSYKQ
jgi:hypothetical protein